MAVTFNINEAEEKCIRAVDKVSGYIRVWVDLLVGGGGEVCVM